MRLPKQLLQLGVDGRKAAIVAYLKQAAPFFVRLEYALGVGEIGGHGLFTKHMLALFGRDDRQLGVFRVRSRNVDRIAGSQYFAAAVRERGAGRARQLLRTLLNHVVDRGNLNALVARQNRGVNSGNVSGAEETDLDLSHWLSCAS